jgi:predicted PurR-regulated permease PerM
MSDEQPRSGIDWRRLHLWEIQLVRDLALLGLIVGVVYIGYVVRVVTVPLLLALLLAYLFEPLVRWLRMRRLASRRWAALGLIAAFIGLVVVPLSLGAGFGVVQGVKAAGVLATNAGAVQKSIATPDDQALRDKVPAGAWREIRDFLAVPSEDADDSVGFAAMRSETREDLRVLARRVVDYAGEHAEELARWGGTRVLGGGAQAVGAAVDTVISVGAVLFTIGLTAFFFYFFCTGWGKVLEFWDDLIPERRRGRTIEIVRQMDRVIAGFVRGRLTICFILSIYMTIAYWLVGVPTPLILGPVIGMLFIVPYIHAIGMPVAMLLMWLGADGAGSGLTSQWWWIVGAPIGVYVVAQLLDDWVLSPLIQGKTTDLPIPTILFASLAGGALAGIYGLLIAIPIAACIRILLNEVFWPRFRQWARGERPDFLPIAQRAEAGAEPLSPGSSAPGPARR